MLISQRAFDLIVACEVTSRAVYEKSYTRPTWPRGRSGVTVAIGYDLGYCSLEKLHADFDGRISDTMIRVMTRCLGVTGDAARDLLPSVRNLVLIPWDVALAVFSERDIPEWTEAVCKALPGAANLPPDCLGALVSLAYNRGCSFDKPGDRYTEMRNIKRWMISGELGKIPGEIRAMKRLWGADEDGLLTRRDQEAALFSAGLVARPIKLPPIPDAPRSIPRLPPDVPPIVKPEPAPQPVRQASWVAAFVAAVYGALQSPTIEYALLALTAGAVVVLAIHLFWPKGESQ